MFDSFDLQSFLSIAAIQTMAVISPGPDFAVVSRNSILHSRKVGLFTSIGIAAGVLFHITYLVLGFGYFANKLTSFLLPIKIAGCIYLGYLGWKGIVSKGPTSFGFEEKQNQLTPQSGFWMGFLTNVLNPKAILFLVSLFTVGISPNTPMSILVLYGFMIVAITFAWFLIVTFSFSGILRNSFLRLGAWTDRVTGGFLLFVSTKIGLSCFM